MAKTSEFLKSLDPHHLVTIGSEGFLGSSTPGRGHCSILADWLLVAALQLPNIVFNTHHQ